MKISLPVLEKEKTALLIVDMQNDFCTEGGQIHRVGYEIGYIRQIIPNIAKLLKVARELDLHIGYIKAIHEPDGKDLISRRHEILPEALSTLNEKPICMRGTWGSEIVDELKPKSEKGEFIVEKKGYSAFHSTDLERLLRDRRVKTCIFAGAATHVCVESTVRGAFDRDFDVIVVSDCTASTYEEMYKATLKAIEHSFGLVASSDEVIAMLKAGE